MAVTSRACANFLFLSSSLIAPLRVSLQCGGISNCAATFESQGAESKKTFCLMYLRLWMMCNLCESRVHLEFRWSALCFLSFPPPSHQSCDSKQKLPQRSKLRIAQDHWLRAMLRPQWKLQGAVWERNKWSYRCVTPGRWEVCVMVMMAYIDSRFYIWI